MLLPLYIFMPPLYPYLVTSTTPNFNSSRLHQSLTLHILQDPLGLRSCVLQYNYLSVCVCLFMAQQLSRS